MNIKINYIAEIGCDKIYKNKYYGFEFQCFQKSDSVSEVSDSGQFFIDLSSKDYGLSFEIINKKFDPTHIFTSFQPTLEIKDSQLVYYNNIVWYKFLLPDFQECSNGFYITNLANNQTLQLSYERCDQNQPTFLHDHPEVISQFLSTFKFIK